MKRLLMGAEAIAEAAINSGLEAYFGYPITPSSEIMENLAVLYASHRSDRFRVYFQSASEVESINLLMGAGAAGHITMTATSGPGLSLMAEGISYAYTSEIPLVIINVNRGGPGLGNVAPEQSDYLFVTKSLGHGGSKPIVLAPSSIKEAMGQVRMAFELSFKYRIPVIILTDAIIIHMLESVDLDQLTPVSVDANWSARGRNGGARHLINSIYLEPAEFSKIKAGLEEKWKTIEPLGECFMCNDAETLFVAYGISARIAMEAASNMRENNIRAGVFRPITLNPFPGKMLVDAAKNSRRIIVVEMNEGQMVLDVQYWLRRDVELIPFNGGIYPSTEEVIERYK
ncbi:MAG: transketolase C-terminal domain-containing protein [Conexivisphaerales archaeon]